MGSRKVKYLKINEIADLLEVSAMTVRNWQKTDVIPYNITEQDLESIKNSITHRNNKRANKTKNSNFFIPINYLNNRNNEFKIKEICKELNNNDFDLKQKVYLISLLYLRQKNEVDNNLNFKRRTIEEICRTFSQDIEIYSVISCFKVMDYCLPTDECDVLGAFYQSLKSIGNKSKYGSFYTSPSLANRIIEEDGVKDAKVLDPCCGTGAFLIKLSHKFSFENIYAFDIDDIAIYLAKINILLSYPEIDKMPNIFSVDSLDSDVKIPDLGYVCSNPPWGAFKNSDKYIDYKKMVGSSEVFSMFLYKYVNMLSDRARLSFILPESFLNVSSHSKIRSYICNNYSINRIECLGRQFSDVFTPVILLTVDKKIPSDNHQIIVKVGEDSFVINQSRYKNNVDCIFDIIPPGSVENKILEKIYSVDYHTLKNNAQWGLGIVTGNNARHLKIKKDASLEAVFTGKEVKKMNLSEPKFYIKFDKKSLQQTSHESLYRAEEKLIYKFISSDLIVSYDNNQSLTLNSANIIIPKIENYSVKLVAAILNSSVSNFVFKKKFNTFKVLKRHLESLPIVKLSLQQIIELENIIECYFKGYCDYKVVNDYILNLYNFTREELDVLNKF